MKPRDGDIWKPMMGDPLLKAIKESMEYRHERGLPATYFLRVTRLGR